MRGQKVKFEENEKHGRLTVVRPLNTTKKRGQQFRCLWLFKCDCGNDVECFGSDVKNGRKQSCGCLYREHKDNCGKWLGLLNIKPNKEGPIKKLFGSYRRHSLGVAMIGIYQKMNLKSFCLNRVSIVVRCHNQNIQRHRVTLSKKIF